MLRNHYIIKDTYQDIPVYQKIEPVFIPRKELKPVGQSPTPWSKKARKQQQDFKKK